MVSGARCPARNDPVRLSGRMDILRLEGKIQAWRMERSYIKRFGRANHRHGRLI